MVIVKGSRMAELAPHTLHGWYALHQMYCIDRTQTSRLTAEERAGLVHEVETLLSMAPDSEGSSAVFELLSGRADIMFVHFRPTLDELARVARTLKGSRIAEVLRLEYDFVSVAEAALYHATVEAQLMSASSPADYDGRLAELVAAERASPRMLQRLQPVMPPDWRYVCFYPMNRRRSGDDNWYTLPLEDRNRLLNEHGLTGRRYAGRILQIITGSTGLSDWEWGVTLCAKDPLELKRIVAEMRFDGASARYAEFGRTFTGIRINGEPWV